MAWREDRTWEPASVCRTGIEETIALVGLSEAAGGAAAAGAGAAAGGAAAGAGTTAVHNIPSAEAGSFKFPDDSRLSDDVRTLGYFCAWSHKSYTHCLGHDPGQIEGDPDYYARNYSAKSALGVDGLQRLMADARNRPPVVRRSVVFSDQDIQPERTAQPGEVGGIDRQRARDNGFGALTSIEINPDAAKVARDRVAEFGARWPLV